MTIRQNHRTSEPDTAGRYSEQHIQQNTQLHTQQHLLALHMARLALRSLHAELVLYPKPGLVSLRDNGSHTDMNAETFMRSLFSLRHYFKAMAMAGIRQAEFTELKQLGIQAEQRMLIATAGINTHRGAIFALGMLCAASATHLAHFAGTVDASAVRQTLLHYWGDALLKHTVVKGEPGTVSGASHGQQVARQFAASGAREEAALGFPSVFELALPRLHLSLHQGRSLPQAQVDSLFLLMAHISDTNLYHRGGAEGVAFTRTVAGGFLQRGGTAQPDWMAQAEHCHQEFIARRLSPGGAADLLAATCFVYFVEQYAVNGMI
ncbi:triphosphoribosyl-dephospho-CoA synthase MdcB [Undibacterium sp. SXout7W]|uniref:triphosphoribosyl-dephospho-CoA synthase MdcB n=1 Tax=Undibacterium sp. SXout7W TaxID=3413049 RepID=UPI003BF45955